MALKDKLDREFTDKLLKKTLVSGRAQKPVATNDDLLVSQDNIVNISNSLTSLQNSFYKIYAYSSNIRALHQFEEKRLLSIKKENNLENKLSTGSMAASDISSAAAGPDLVDTFDALSESIDGLTRKLRSQRGGGLGSGGSAANAAATALPLLLGATKFGRRVLGPLGIGLDVYDRYSEGQSGGQIAAGVGGGLAGAALGAKGGAALGGAIGAAFGGVGAVPGAAIGGFLGGVGGYFGGSYLGDTAYESFEQRAAGGPVRAGGTYVVGERGPEVLVMNGRAGRVLSTNTKSASRAERELVQAAERSAKGRAKLEKGKPISDTSYSSKFANYLRDTFANVSSWVSRTGGFLSRIFGRTSPVQTQQLGPGQYNPLGDLSQVTGDWKNDTEFLTAIDSVARKYNIDANDLIGLIYHETGGSMSPTEGRQSGARGLFQFTRGGGFNPDEVATMSRAQQVYLADERIFAASGMPRGANAGQIYAAVFLPGVAKEQGWQGVISRRGDRFYGSNPSLDTDPKDGVIDYGDLARVISGHRVRLGLGPSPTLTGGVMSAQGFVSPVSGQIGSGFGMRNLNGETRPHEGVDYPIPSGTPVRAAKGGNILRAGVVGGYGNMIEIDHGGGVTSLYAHLSRFVKTSGSVQPGELIAYSGGGRNDPGRGRSTGAHLHFEIRVNGQGVDPTPYLGAPATALPVPQETLRTVPYQDTRRRMSINPAFVQQRPPSLLMQPRQPAGPMSVAPWAQGGNNLRSYWPETR